MYIYRTASSCQEHLKSAVGRRILASILGTCLVLSGVSEAQNAPQPTPPNGCGSGWSLPFVPDSLPLVGCQFKAACDNHDLCYGHCETSSTGECEYRRCRKGGDLEGAAECLTNDRLLALEVKANERKEVCDNKLAIDIRQLNKGKPICEAFAEIYRTAVQMLGRSAFVGMTSIGVLGQSTEDYNNALKEFLANGTDAQFKAFVAGVDSGRPTVDLKKPIAYDTKKGLINVSPR